MTGRSAATSAPEPTGRLSLALALAPEAVSMDTLVGWSLARPVDLWAFLEEARTGGAIAEDGGAGRGHFRWADARRRAQLLADAQPADWDAVVACPELIPAAAQLVREAVRGLDTRLAERVCRALLAAPRERFPGGESGWVKVVIGCFRLFPNVDWLGAPILDGALAIATARGDLASQVTLQGARGWLSARLGQSEAARAAFAAAREAAAALESPTAVQEAQLFFAIGHFMEGRHRQAIEEFDRLQGDLPYPGFGVPWYRPGAAEPAPATGPEWRCPFDVEDSPVPQAPLGALAWAHVLVGQYPQALELLHRIAAQGERAGRRPVVHMARTLLGGLAVERRDVEAARPLTAAEYEYWRTSGASPHYEWLAAGYHAWVLWRDGRGNELHAVLEAGHRARTAALYPQYEGSALLEVLEWMEVAERPAVPGLTLEGELARLLAWPDTFTQGVAQRFAARRLARTGGPGARERIVEHLSRSASLLREVGARPELARTLEESAAGARRHGDADEAARLLREAGEVRASLPEAPAMPPPRGTIPPAAQRVLQLGRLASVDIGHGRRWGDLAARLCEDLGAERCALVDASEGLHVLTARGGDGAWLCALLDLLRDRPLRGPEFVAPPAEPGGGEAGQLVLVPFALRGLGRRGWLCLENRHGPPLVAPGDVALLDVLGTQVGVVVENVTLWREVEEARRRLEQELRYYRQQAPAPAQSGMIGSSPALQAVFDLVERVAPGTTAVLVLGETGSGKELVAREIHRRSPRADGPFIAVHIASLSPGLVASGLFGHERGAFTGASEQVKGRFELADRGTLFLDEIGELGPEEQVRLLRVLQEGVFERVGGTRALRSDFRLVCATNRDLEAEVRAGRFREDLFFRLNVFPIRVPPLRERAEDIPTLALHFMERVGRNTGRRFEGISEADMQRLLAYAWPGNVRELEHVIERASLLSEPPRLRIPPLTGTVREATPAPREWVTLEEAERRYLRQVLEHTGGRITGDGGAAQILGMKPSTLNWRLGKASLRDDLARIRAGARRR